MGGTCYAFNFYIWEEIQSADRAETLELIERYLDERLNLITIQLGENVNSIDTFEADYEELIWYIRQRASTAQIIVVDDFWVNDNKFALKKEAANNAGRSVCRFK